MFFFSDLNPDWPLLWRILEEFTMNQVRYNVTFLLIFCVACSYFECGLILCWKSKINNIICKGSVRNNELLTALLSFIFKEDKNWLNLLHLWNIRWLCSYNVVAQILALGALECRCPGDCWIYCVEGAQTSLWRWLPSNRGSIKSLLSLAAAYSSLGFLF